jgi:class 3 adenylate cyclase
MDSDNRAEEIAKAQVKVVLFADLLGFAALTEQHPIDALALRGSDRLDAIFGAVFNKNPLTHAFTEFHRAIRWTLQLSQLRHSSTAITFSDSAFVATTRLHEAVGIAVHLMQSLLRRGVPLRMGIACGSFEAVRFRSDISADGGDHAAHFLGTGVVCAHRTESCGINGCRILLHPSVAILLDDPLHNPPAPASEHVMHLECSAVESQNKPGVMHEINYWSFGSTEEKRAWRELQKMWDEAPEAEHRHFQTTAEAIDRMRVARGEAPISNLRRRTIVRRSSRKA